GMAALGAVRLRPAPVLLEEGAQAVLGPGEVLLGVHRPQLGIVGDALVEAVHEAREGLVTADGLVEAEPCGLRVGTGHDGEPPGTGRGMCGVTSARSRRSGAWRRRCRRRRSRHGYGPAARARRPTAGPGRSRS